MSHVRDLGRRPVRTALTILGIAIGIWALVVFGSMANKISALVQGGSTYYEDKISLSDSAGSMGGFSAAPMAIAQADDVRQIDGVAAVQPAVMVLMGDQRRSTMGVPPMINGAELRLRRGPGTFETRYAEGRALTADDATALVTVLGSDIARKYDKHVGDTIDLRGSTFTVVGVLEPTLTAPDQAALGPAPCCAAAAIPVVAARRAGPA